MLTSKSAAYTTENARLFANFCQKCPDLVVPRAQLLPGLRRQQRRRRDGLKDAQRCPVAVGIAVVGTAGWWVNPMAAIN